MPNSRMHIVIYSGKEIMPFQRLMIRKMPAGRALLPEGDFRDWNDIEASAIGIARAQSSGGRNNLKQRLDERTWMIGIL